MTGELQEKALSAAKLEVDGILCDNWGEIMEAYDEAKSEFDRVRDFNPKKRFSYGISLKVTIGPHGRDTKVSASVAWSVTHKDETEGVTISDQPELPLDPALEGKDEKIEANRAPEELAAEADNV